MMPVITPNQDCGFGLKREEECRTFSHFALDPNPASVDFDNPLDQGKPNSCAIGVCIQLVEQAKDAVMMNRVNAHAVVPDIENRLIIFISIQTDLDAGMGLSRQ